MYQKNPRITDKCHSMQYRHSYREAEKQKTKRSQRKVQKEEGKKTTNQPTNTKIQPSVSNEYPLHKNLGGPKRINTGSQEDSGRMKYLSQNE